MLLIWVGFIVLVLLLLALDLGVFHRRSHEISIPEALAWTVFWVVLSLAFNVLVFYLYERNWLGIGAHLEGPMSGREAALKFFAAYLLEKSLSVDNIFVIAMIFAYFQVPPKYQHRTLFWGILGALVMRGAMITLGIKLMGWLTWMVYVFGALLIFTAVKMLITRHDNIEPDRNPLVRLTRRLYPVTGTFHEHHFFVHENGQRVMTPLFLVLMVIESTDLLFAVDSVPAVLAVTWDPFLAFTSNVFAILGLRSLYFALAGMMHKFQYLKMSLVFLLAYVGVKMILQHHVEIPIEASLAVIGGILAVGVLASLLASHRDTAPLASPLPQEAVSLGMMAWRQVRRVVIFVVGASVMLFGFVLFFTPGPAVVVIPLGLLILSTEFLWAKRLLNRLRDKLRREQTAAADPQDGPPGSP